MHAARTRFLPAVVLAAAVFGVLFLALTAGVQRLSTTEPTDFTDDAGHLPRFVHDPPPTVATTAEYGPVGPVSVVFAGGAVRTGLTDMTERAWIAVSSQTGDYRTLVAPHLPPPAADAMTVSADGRMLAWAAPEGVVLYDAVTDRAREIALGAMPSVGTFSPNGELLAVHDGSLRVVEVSSEEVVGVLDAVNREQARQAVWTPDGEALTFVDGGALVIRPWRGGTPVRVPGSLRADATLDWHPSGEQLAATRTAATGNRLRLFDVRTDGTMSPAGTISREGHSLHRMLGFSSDTTITAIGLSLETGPIPLVYRISTQGPSATDVMQLPADGRILRTVEIATEPMRNGSSPFPEPDWPVGDLAKLVLSIVATLFLVGLYLTRRPREH